MKARSYKGNKKVSGASHLFQGFMPYGQVSRLAAVSRLKGEGTSGKIREHLTDDGVFG